MGARKEKNLKPKLLYYREQKSDKKFQNKFQKTNLDVWRPGRRQRARGGTDVARWRLWWGERTAKCRRNIWVPELSKQIAEIHPVSVLYMIAPLNLRLIYSPTFPCFRSYLILQKREDTMLWYPKSRISGKEKGGKQRWKEKQRPTSVQKVCWDPLWWPALSDPNNWPLQHNKHIYSHECQRDLGHLNR